MVSVKLCWLRRCFLAVKRAAWCPIPVMAKCEGCPYMSRSLVCPECKTKTVCARTYRCFECDKSLI